MSKTKYYRQCTIKKENIYQVTYLPEIYAVVGQLIKIKDSSGQWDNGWKVEKIGELQDAEWVEGNERNYTKQRQASDI